MKNINIKIILMIILPWITIPFIGLNSIRKYLPGALFISFFVFLEGFVAEKRKWWWFHQNIKPNVLGELPLIVGPFFVGSLWILKFTYGKFKTYFLVNLIVDSIFTYLIINWFKKIGYASLVRLTRTQLSIIFIIKTVLMYAFQSVFEKFLKRITLSNSDSFIRISKQSTNYDVTPQS